MRLPFFNSCVGWYRPDIYREGGLDDMIGSSIEITRRTFLKHVNLDDLKILEEDLGYDRHLHMASDYAVSYYRSKLHGKRVYYFTQSSIEYVFAAK